jgi:hypothetical protein
MERTKYGNFRMGDYVAVPYRHHANSHIWEVIVIKKYDIERIRVVGFNAEDAAHSAITQYEDVKKDKKICLSMRKLQEREHVRQKRDAFCRGESKLDQLQSKTTRSRGKTAKC